MGALTDIYVAATSGSDVTGDGSSGNPYKTVQGGPLTLATRDGTNGNYINLSGTDTLAAALDFTLWGTPTVGAQTVLRNWVGGPDGQGVLDGNNGGFTIYAGGKQHINFENLELRNVGAATIVTIGNYSYIAACTVHLANGTGIVIGSANGGRAIGNNIYDCKKGITGSAIWTAAWNYMADGGTYQFTSGVEGGSGAGVIINNIINVSGAGKGILLSQYYENIIGNSILSAGGTGIGVDCGGDKQDYGGMIANNLIEGFSGVGGIGIKATGGDASSIFNNGLYNNATNYSFGDRVLFTGDGNEALSGTPFFKSGSNTYANRFTYFAPVDVGSVIAGGYQMGSRLSKGAVQVYYVIPDADQVEDGVSFGINGGDTGTLEVGSGGGTDDWIIGGPNG